MFSNDGIIKNKTLTQIINKLGDLLFKHDLIIDSRKVTKGSIFCAYPGANTDGRDYIEAAIKNNAAFILWESEKYEFKFNIPNLPVKNLKYYVGILAAIAMKNPTNKIKMLGVTGTNGKTSITYWLNQAYMLLSKKSAIIGTTGAGVYPNIKDYAMTTPDPITLQKLLAEFAQEKCKIVAMEVSSHALDQGRVNGVNFNTAIFTNLTQDHLDYHKTMSNYFQAKRKLFFWNDLVNAVINVDDKYGKKLYAELSKQNKTKVISYGIEKNFTEKNHKKVIATHIKLGMQGTSFRLCYAGKCRDVLVKLIGKFNIYNLLAVVGTLISDGYSLDNIADILPKLKPVFGRMDTIFTPNKPLIIIDYAHTPDALKNALSTLQQVELRGELYCIFGCGGNRDAKKRPLMGEIATKFADHVIITSDNPRNEDSNAIIKQIEAGITQKKNYLVIANRRLAITKTIKKASANDIILIAGKGHETYQEINGVKHHFSDYEVAQESLNKVRE
ncbi:MAG TPA: UDP-N-acetylmuramoyl-L-alanyl-D-glutamate--2,6-diaminopimelate ligase [Burkholderiales bacterium]|nr:UDP-N-acetylmuramoyl-L-alanyl-D-glutamate--2,6-diaminopimelate ligase [Burkholderiales bacterium]